MDLVFPTSAPRVDQLSTQVLSYQIPPRELMTQLLAIYAFASIDGVSLRADDRRQSQGDHVISADNIDIRSVFSMRRLHGNKHFIARPLILEKQRSLSIAKEQSQLYYITIHIPASTPAGGYSSNVRIMANGEVLQTMKVELTVLPFELPPAPALYVFWYDARGTAEKVRKDLIAMHGCGINSVMLGQGHEVKVRRKGDRVTFDFTNLVDFMEHYQPAGFIRPLVYNVVLDVFLDLTDEQYTECLHAMTALAEARGWPGFIWSVGDENDARPADILVRARRVLARTNTAVPDQLTKNTMIHHSMSEVYGTDLDIRVWGFNFSEVVVESTRKAGAQLGMYNGT